MGIASEMRRLTQDIASSRQDRVKRLHKVREEASQTREEAKGLIKGFQTSRRETGVRLRNELTRDKAQRKSEAQDILKEAQDILRSFRTSRNETGAQLREELSKGMADRRSEVRKTLEDAEKSIRGFKASRKKMGSEVRRELGQSRSRAKSEVAQLLGDAQALVKDFGRSRREEGNRSRKELAKNRTERESDVKRMQGNFRKAQAEVRADLREAAAAWQELANTMQAKRARPEALVPKQEASDFEAKLLAAVNKHPKGLSLAEVADSLGVASVVLGRASRRLLMDGKIRKKEKFYFPVAGR